METRDSSGRLLNDKQLRYDGAPFEGLAEGQAMRGVLRRSEELVLADWALANDYAATLDPSWGLIHHGEGWYKLVDAYEHDDTGNIIRQRDALGRTASVTYDADRLFPVERSDAEGRVTRASFDARTAQPLSVVSPEGLETRYQYAPLGRLRAQYESDGVGVLQLTQAFVVRDALLGQATPAPACVISVRPREPSVSIEFVETSNLASAPNLSVEYAYYDGRGNVLQRAKRAGSAAGGWVIGARRAYTRNDQPAIEYPNVQSASPTYMPVAKDSPGVRLFYDGSGRIERIEHPNGRFQATHRLNRVEKRDAETADNEPPVVERYNALGHLIGVDTPDGSGGVAQTRYTVDHAGRILSITDARGVVTVRYVYAGPGGAIQIEHVEAGGRTYFRDALGALRRRTDTLGRVLALAYDTQGRLTTATDLTDAANARIVRRMTYAASGLAQHEELGVTTSFVNDAIGRPTAKTLAYEDGQSLTIMRSYGLQSEVRALTYPDGTALQFDYYDNGGVRRIAGAVEQVDYDVHDNLLSVEFAGGVRTSCAYDPLMNRILGVGLHAGPVLLRQLEFGYSGNGLVQTVEDTTPAAKVSHRYTYDRMYRLTGAASFEGELDGILTRQDGYTYSSVGDVLTNDEGTGAAYRYEDGAHPSRLTASEGPGGVIPVLSDNGGRLTSYGAVAAVRYDIWDRIVSVTLTSGVNISFAYDASNQMVWREVIRPDGGREVTRYMDGVYEASSSGSRIPILVGKRLVAVRVTATGSASKLIYVLTDHLGSVLTLCDAGGNVLHHQAYTPFGRPIRATAPGDERYAGASPDPSLNLLPMGARWYHPELARFITPDWHVIENPNRGQRLPQALNVFSYAINSPMSLRDPTGLFFGIDDLIVAGVGFAVGFVTGVIVGIAEGRSFGATLLLGLEAGLCGAAGAWLAYVTVGAATAALGAMGFGLSSGVATGLAVGGAAVGGLNGVISGSLEIYAWDSPIGWFSFLADSSWGLPGTTLGILVHGVNLFYGSSRDYSFDLSRRQNRHVYDGGFGFGPSAFTQGNVTSHMNYRRTDLVDHETAHIWQSRIFGPVFTATYIGWLVVGGVVGFLIGIGMKVAGEQGIGQSIVDVAYCDNPWENWAYSYGGTGSRCTGKLSWN